LRSRLTPVDVATDTLDPMIDAVLSEDTLETMALAYGGGVNLPAPGVVGTVVGRLR